MKIRHLQPTDLARLTCMTDVARRQEIARIKKGGFSKITYRAARNAFVDVFEVPSGPLVLKVPTTWSGIEQRIRLDAENFESAEACIQICKGLLKYAKDRRITGQRVEILPISLGFSKSFAFWSDLALLINNRRTVAFFDPRRSNGLTAEARRFVFSVMREHLKAYPDLDGCALSIFQFGDQSKDGREVKLHLANDVTLLSQDEIEARITFVRRAWDDYDMGSQIRPTGTLL